MLAPFEGEQPGDKVQVQWKLAALEWKVTVMLFDGARGGHVVGGHIEHWL
jgi:hypothetical protein